MFDKLLMDNKELVILGDLVVDYSGGSSSQIHVLVLECLVHKATRVTASSSTCINLILTIQYQRTML